MSSASILEVGKQAITGTDSIKCALKRTLRTDFIHFNAKPFRQDLKGTESIGTSQWAPLVCVGILDGLVSQITTNDHLHTSTERT